MSTMTSPIASIKARYHAVVSRLIQRMPDMLLVPMPVSTVEKPVRVRLLVEVYFTGCLAFHRIMRSTPRQGL